MSQISSWQMSFMNISLPRNPVKILVISPNLFNIMEMSNEIWKDIIFQEEQKQWKHMKKMSWVSSPTRCFGFRKCCPCKYFGTNPETLQFHRYRWIVESTECPQRIDLPVSDFQTDNVFSLRCRDCVISAHNNLIKIYTIDTGSAIPPSFLVTVVQHLMHQCLATELVVLMLKNDLNHKSEVPFDEYGTWYKMGSDKSN